MTSTPIDILNIFVQIITQMGLLTPLIIVIAFFMFSGLFRAITRVFEYGPTTTDKSNPLDLPSPSRPIINGTIFTDDEDDYWVENDDEQTTAPRPDISLKFDTALADRNLEKVKCSYCGQSNLASDLKCRQCGAPL